MRHREVDPDLCRLVEVDLGDVLGLDRVDELDVALEGDVALPVRDVDLRHGLGPGVADENGLRVRVGGRRVEQRRVGNWIERAQLRARNVASFFAIILSDHSHFSSAVNLQM